MIAHPIAVLGALMGTVAGLHAVARLAPCRTILRVLPIPFWCYLLPMLATSAGWLPASSPLYIWCSTQLLPVCLTLLLIGTDLRAIARLGPPAAAAMLAGTAGILLGAQLAFTLLQQWLPPTAWMGIGALSATWIGGSANMLAIVESLNVPSDLFAPLVVVDACVSYGWMGLLIASASWHDRWDRWVSADRNDTADRSDRAAAHPTTDRRGYRVVATLALAVALSLGCQRLSEPLVVASGVLPRTTWTILLITTATLALAATPARHLASPATDRLGTWLLLLLLTSMGARASLTAITDMPIWFAAALIWIATHALLLLAVGRLLRLPLSLLATASQANVGGPVSAPLVAAVFHPRLPPLGLAMALLGNVLGTYLGLLSAHLCRLASTLLR